MSGYRILVLIVFIWFDVSVLRGQCIATYPFVEDFEAGTGNWVPGGANGDWAHGSPNKPRINAAGSGAKCWITGGLSNANYNGGQKSWLESPCFDFSFLSRPYLSFLIYWDTERQYDGGNLQYSLNNGVTWQNVGNSSTNPNCRTANWFNASSINNLSGLASPTQGWSGTTVNSSGSCLGGNGSGAWKNARYCLSNLAGEPNVMFRFTFSSGTTCNNYDGLAIDSFSVSELPLPALDFSYSCEGNGRVRFVADAGTCPTGASWNFDDPGSLVNSSTSSVDTHTFSGPGEYFVTWTLTEPCIGSRTVTRKVVIPDVDATVYPESCPGALDGAIALTIPAYPGLLISWNTIPVQTADSLSGLAAGTYEVVVNADSACALVSRIEVETNPDALPKSELPQLLFICPPEELQVTPGVFAFYEWSDGSNDSFFDIFDAGTYSVTITSAAGCTATDSVVVLENCFTDVFLPSAFTPNVDGKNEVFMPVSGVIPFMRFSVYNRMGQQLFITETQNSGWDGTYSGGECPEGIYAWKVEYRGPDNKNREKYGWFMLIR